MKYRKPAKFHPHPFEYHQEIELRIDSLTNMGLGVGRMDGWVVMVPFALPDELVRASVFRNHKNYSEADLIEMVEPSSERIEPVCPLFGECGGCQYQHFNYLAQLEWKRRQVEELLARMAGILHHVDPVAGSPIQFGYRTKLTPHYDRPREGAAGEIGFLKSGHRHNLVDVPHCPIASDAINDALPAIRETVRKEAQTRRKGATLLIRDSLEGVTTDHHAVVTEQVGNLKLQFEAGTFFQNNPHLLPELVAHVCAESSGEGTEFLVDAYCGSGLFALACAPSFSAVSGVEISEKSIKWAIRNAKANGIENCRFLATNAAEIFAEIQYPPEKSVVIIDPPRRGCDPEFIAQLVGFAPRRILYVSCNPATQMRDLAELSVAGYAVTRVRPFDMFPQTKHLECVVTLQRDSPDAG